MASVVDIVAALERIAPQRLAAEWDSVGLLVAPRERELRRVLTCLTLTPEVAAEAVRERIDLVVTHHPLPFRPIGRITPDTATGRVLLTLVGAGCGVWSSHTAWDSAAGGINDQLAALAGIVAPRPIAPDALDPAVGFGRMGPVAPGMTVAALARRVAGTLGASGVQLVGDRDRAAGRVGIVCGSGGDLVSQVAAAGCTTLLTGEIKLHQACEARATDLAVVAVGHQASEHFAMAELGRRLVAELPGLETVVSREDRDPIMVL